MDLLESATRVKGRSDFQDECVVAVKVQIIGINNLPVVSGVHKYATMWVN